MAQDTAQLKKQIQFLIKRGIKAAGNQLVAEADQWVPLFENALRESARVGNPKVDSKGFEIEITYGNDDVKYARKQYFASLRHHMAPGGKPLPITRLRGAFDIKIPTGLGKQKLYNRSYQQALKEGLLHRVPGGLKWLERALQNSRSRKRIDQSFIAEF